MGQSFPHGVVALCLAALTACTPAAPPPITTKATAASLDKAKIGVQACRDGMPNMAAVRATLESNGFKSTGRMQGMGLFDSSDGQVRVALTLGDPLEKICGVAVQGMNGDQGIEMIQPWVQLTNATPNSVVSPTAAAAWRGELQGDIAFTAVNLRPVNDDFEGAWVRLIVIDR